MDTNKTYRVLEYYKILDKLASYTDSDEVKKRISELVPSGDPAHAKAAQKETTEAVSALLKLGSPPVSLSVPNVTAAVKRSEMGGTLNLKDLMSVSRVLYVARRLKSYLSELDDSFEVLGGICSALISAKSLEESINSAILSETEVADDASSELLSIRRRMRTLNSKIKDSLNSMIHSSHYQKYLQDALVTMRADRYVIPVRSEYRNEVPGIVHDTSASGATLFIEPMSVVNANNEIRDLLNKEEQEIEKILISLTALVSEQAGAILADYKELAELDFIFCKGKLSLDFNGSEPQLNDNGIIEFKHARHPLISPDTIVANDIYLGESFDTLVITGPNTGGKTVTLKTIGLFSLMAASGLHLPVRDGSRAAVFSKVFADIGDEQSIEQSLSTFSSHMVNIVNILKSTDENTLALFDELGAGTDPTEGAALAISILEHLKLCGVKTVATTHYSELKLFALSTDRVENASCEFDVESLRPTYKLLIGVPGKSNAFSISRRLGLDERILGRANELLSDEDIKFEDVITDLEQNRAKAQSEKEYAERMRREIIDLKAQLESERIKIKENKARILEDARREAKILVMDAKDEANEIIRDLERMRIQGGKNIDEKISKSRERLKKKSDSIDSQMQKAQKPRKAYREPPKNLKAGDTVKIISMDQEASIIKPPGKDGMARVEAGIFKMDVHVSNLALCKEDSKPKSGRTVNMVSSKAKSASTQIDVRGQTLDEAIINVDKFLDDSCLAGIGTVTIIHGKGTGVLRKGIQDMLKRHKYVKSYRNGSFGEGEMGVTIAELK